MKRNCYIKVLEIFHCGLSRKELQELGNRAAIFHHRTYYRHTSFYCTLQILPLKKKIEALWQP